MRRVRPRRFREHGVNLHLYLHGLSGRYDFQGEWIFVVKPVNGKYIGQGTQGLHRFEVNPKSVAVQRLKTEERLNSLMRARNAGKVEVILKYTKPLVEGNSYSLNLKTKYQY